MIDEQTRRLLSRGQTDVSRSPILVTRCPDMSFRYPQNSVSVSCDFPALGSFFIDNVLVAESARSSWSTTTTESLRLSILACARREAIKNTRFLKKKLKTFCRQKFLCFSAGCLYLN
jgi:hypothetical protein